MTNSITHVHRKSCWSRETTAAVTRPSVKIPKWKHQTHHIVSKELWNQNVNSMSLMQHAIQWKFKSSTWSDKLLIFDTNFNYYFSYREADIYKHKISLLETRKDGWWVSHKTHIMCYMKGSDLAKILNESSFTGKLQDVFKALKSYIRIITRLGILLLFCSWRKTFIPLMLLMFPCHASVSDLFYTWIDELSWICTWLLLVISTHCLP